MKNNSMMKYVLSLVIITITSCTTIKQETSIPSTLTTLQEFEDRSRNEIVNEIEVYFKIMEMGFREGRMLTPEEMIYANKLQIVDPEGIRVLEYARIPVFLKREIIQIEKMGYDRSYFDPYGAAYPRTIMLKKENPDKLTAIIHELVHVKQIQEMGLIKMDAQYNYDFELYGYVDSPLEIEAREKAIELQK